MAWDFPNAPSEGQQFTPVAGGPTYVYRAPAWELVTVAGVSISDTPPANPLVGQEWFESDTGNTFVWYNDGNTSQWVQTNGTGLLPTTSTARNRLVNSAMQISQENGTTGGVANSYFMADQWQSLFYSTVGVLALFKYTGFTSPQGNKNRVMVQVNTPDASLASDEYLCIAQNIEGTRVADFLWGTASARQVVLRFGVRSTIAGTFGGSLRNAASNRSYPFSYTISAGEVNTDVYRTFVIPGDVTGTWATDTTTGIGLFFTFAAGSVFIAPASAWGATAAIAPTGITNGFATTSAQFGIFDAGLYLDADKTGVAPRWEMPDEAQELAACKRYWQQIYTMFSGNVVSPSGYYAIGAVPVTMRVLPAFAGTNQVNISFPATPGTAALGGPQQMHEYRVSNATANSAIFTTVWALNARM